MGNKANSKITALQNEGYNFDEYEVVKNTILLLNEKGEKSYIFGWYVTDDTLIKLVEKGFECTKESDIFGKYTSIRWYE